MQTKHVALIRQGYVVNFIPTEPCTSIRNPRRLHVALVAQGYVVSPIPTEPCTIIRNPRRPRVVLVAQGYVANPFPTVATSLHMKIPPWTRLEGRGLGVRVVGG